MTKTFNKIVMHDGCTSSYTRRLKPPGSNLNGYIFDDLVVWYYVLNTCTYRNNHSQVNVLVGRLGFVGGMMPEPVRRAATSIHKKTRHRGQDVCQIVLRLRSLARSFKNFVRATYHHLLSCSVRGWMPQPVVGISERKDPRLTLLFLYCRPPRM